MIHSEPAVVENDQFGQEAKATMTTLDNNPVVENGSPWGLARISHRDGLDFRTFTKYIYASEGGEGVNVYVIDSGCHIWQVDFEGRAFWGKIIPSGLEDEDDNGRGTHLAGIIAGHKYGVAKKAHIYAVKALDGNGSGSVSDILKGIEWTVAHHIRRRQEQSGFKASVANLALSQNRTNLLNDAVDAAVAEGVHFAVAAGDANDDSCYHSPASAARAVTVGASTLGDERAYFSGWGKCVDLFAPGLNIQSTWTGSKHAINTVSGTAMASAHVAGLLAYTLSLLPDTKSQHGISEISPDDLKRKLISIASRNRLSELPENTVNLIAFNGGGGSAPDLWVGDGA